MGGAAVEVRNVSRMFHLSGEDVWAVRDVTMSVAPGEFVALIGRSGSGKTTLLNLIGGLDRPTSGEIEIDGQRVDTMSEKELTHLRRHKLGFVFQSFGLLPLLSAQENVELPLRIAGYSNRDRAERVRRALELVGLSRRAHHRPYELSGGEQQRVAIARAMAINPVLLLADEPTGELDSATASIVFGLLRDLARSEGITVITCTHDRLVMEMADRVEELADGRLVTGRRGDVWKHVQSKPRSPFEAGAEVRLSSLVGADIQQFARPANGAQSSETEAAAEPAPEPSPPEETPAEPEDDIYRWAPPGRRRE